MCVVQLRRKKKSVESGDEKFMKTKVKMCQLHESTFKGLLH